MASSLNQEPRRGMVLPFQPLSLAFNHISYYVDMPASFRGPWGALSPIPENNAIAVNTQVWGSVFAASGDSCAYCWDVETGKVKMVFKGHMDYLYCIVARNSSNQIITGSEDGTTLIWCTQVIDPTRDLKLKGSTSWVGCVALDASGSRLVRA
ncbi:THO complex subunit 6 [Glycine soja]